MSHKIANPLEERWRNSSGFNVAVWPHQAPASKKDWVEGMLHSLKSYNVGAGVYFMLFEIMIS